MKLNMKAIRQRADQAAEEIGPDRTKFIKANAVHLIIKDGKLYTPTTFEQLMAFCSQLKYNEIILHFAASIEKSLEDLCNGGASPEEITDFVDILESTLLKYDV